MISSKSLTRKDATEAGVTRQIDGYYNEEKDDYYTREKQPSEWYGSLANDLGINGKAVSKQDFTNLLGGNFKGNTLRDSTYKKKSANDRLGMDLTFNAPKSVSIQALVAGDERLIQAHHEAVKESLAILESHAQARKKVSGKSRIESTNKIAVAMFRHDTNREKDPHLHTHSVLLNITKRASDGEYRALHNDKLVQHIPEASQAYITNLAKKCKALGYDIRLNDNGTFDLAHISRKQIEMFSSRSRQIEEELAKKGLTRATASKEQRQIATLATRRRKEIGDRQETQSIWSKTAERIGLAKMLSPNNTLSQQERIHEYERTNNQSPELGRRRERADDIRGNLTQRSQVEENIQENQGRSRRGNINEQSNSFPVIEQNTDNKSGATNVGTEPDTQANRLYELPGSNVANLTTRREVLLSNHEQLELHEQTTHRNTRMRWRSDGISRIKSIADAFKVKLGFTAEEPIEHLNETSLLENTRTLEDRANYDTITTQITQTNQEKETLKDMMHYETVTDELKVAWAEIANNLSMEFEPGQVVYSEEDNEFAGEKLMKHVVEHLIDKKVDLTHGEIIKETLVKGLGEIDYHEANRMLEKFIENQHLIIAEPLYKAASDKNDADAKTIEQWKNFITKGNTEVSENTALISIENGIKEGRLIPIDQRYVTKEDLATEKQILRIMQEGKGIKSAFYNEQEAEHLLSQSTLNQGQRSAAKLMMTSTDRVVGIQGYAGVGKSYTLSETIKHINEAGGSTHVFAPYGAQVKSLKEDGHEAHTLAKLLISKTLQEQISENSVIIVDEAGVIANQDAERLLNFAEAKNARVVLLGDTQQTKAINAGKPFEVLQTHGMAMATIDEIQRQKEETLKRAVEEAAADKPKESVNTLSKSIYQVGNREKRLDTLVDKFVSLPVDERQKTLIVTGTNEDKDYINGAIRQELGLSGGGIRTEQLKRIDMSKAEMKHARYYTAGHYIEFQTMPHDQNLKKDELYEITGKDGHLLIVKDKQDNEITFNPGREKIAVYQMTEIEISKGDKLRITKGNADFGTVTGDKVVVESIGKDNILVRDQKTNQMHSFKTKDKNHLDYDYCSTVHSSQGLTVDRVLINIDTKSRTTGKEVYYVAVSRAKHEAMIVTDNINRLPDAIAKGAEKHSAYELVGKEHQQNSINEHHHQPEPTMSRDMEL